MARGHFKLEIASGDLEPGSTVAVSIRPHQIEMAPAERAAGGAAHNVFTGIVRRASYLGDAVDYQVELEESGIVLRIAGPAPPQVRAGQTVRLFIPPAASRCARVLSTSSFVPLRD